MDIMRGFSMVGFPSNLPNVQNFFWKGERLGESELLIYNERTFSQPRHRGKEPYIRNPGIPSHSKQGTLHKEPLAAVKHSHRKEG